MRERISLEEAWALITAPLRPLGEEQVDLDHALDRTLSRAVWSSIDQPPFDRSPLTAMPCKARMSMGHVRSTLSLSGWWSGCVLERCPTKGSPRAPLCAL